jgi:hypothetical protein
MTGEAASLGATHKRQLILTSAVRPNVAGPVVVNSVAVRLAQYRSAIGFWGRIANARGFELVIIEASDYGANRLADEAGVPYAVAFDFTAPPDVRERGKGASESAGLDAFLSSDRAGAFFIKVTGRLVAANGARELDRIGDGVSLRMIYGKPWVDTRMFAMHRTDWELHFAGLHGEVSDVEGEYLEVAMGRRALRAVASGVQIDRLPERPYWRGVSGSTGGSYRGPKHWISHQFGRPVEALVSRAVRRKQV